MGKCAVSVLVCHRTIVIQLEKKPVIRDNNQDLQNWLFFEYYSIQYLSSFFLPV